MQATKFTSIASRLRPKLVDAARQILHDDEEAEDAVQEALLSLWRWRERVNSGAETDRKSDVNHYVETLLMRILRNCCLNILHARRRQAAQTSLDELSGSTLCSLTAMTNDPQAILEMKELEQRIRLAFSQLPPRWRKALTMKHLDGLPNPQIATILGLSETATSSLLNRAKQALLQTLHDTTNYKN